MAVREKLDEPAFMLATEPATSGQRRLALAVVAVVFAVFGVVVAIGLTAPFALIPVRIDAFVPALTAMIFVNDFITATLLFGQFSIIRSRALLVVANGYLFTALMAISFALTFPGAFSPTGLLGAGLQSSAWIYNFWHYGFPAGGDRLRNAKGGRSREQRVPWFNRICNWLECSDSSQLGVRTYMARHGGRRIFATPFSGQYPPYSFVADRNFIKHVHMCACANVAI